MSLPLKVAGTSVGRATANSSAGGTLTPGYTLLLVTVDGVGCAVRTGVGAQTAVLTDPWVGIGQSLLLSVPASHTQYACITASGTGNISLTPVAIDEP